MKWSSSGRALLPVLVTDGAAASTEEISNETTPQMKSTYWSWVSAVTPLWKPSTQIQTASSSSAQAYARPAEPAPVHSAQSTLLPVLAAPAKPVSVESN
jgi:hypothetical protein